MNPFSAHIAALHYTLSPADFTDYADVCGKTCAISQICGSLKNNQIQESQSIKETILQALSAPVSAPCVFRPNRSAISI